MLLAAGILAVAIGAVGTLAGQVGAARAGSGAQVYRAERAAISVTLRKEGRYLSRVRVEALFRCSDGHRTRGGFAILGGRGIRITPGGRFNMSRRNAHELSVLKGRVEDGAIRGYFRAFQDSSPEQGFEPRCGTGVPNSQPIHFTARPGGYQRSRR